MPEPYDFRRPMTMAREHARVLEMAFETFARQWGNQLTARLRAMAQVTLDGLSLTSYDEYVRTLPGTTAMMLCTIEQTRQTAVVQVPVSTTMVWIDFLLGGPGSGDPREDRELTEIELTLLRGVMQAALGDLGYAFSALAPLDVTFRSVQYNPQFVQAVPASDAVLVATFQMRVGEREDLATVMFPAELLLAAVRQADGSTGRSLEDQRAHEVALADLEAAVEEVPVEVAVRFAPVVVRPRDVVDLAVGDVVPLSHPSSQPLDVVVDGVVLARAAAGNNGSRLACMVVTVEEKP
ncbi:FliM/FliN family flagellar motor switch protein [Cellulomonas sp. ES6]|uniref:FliM/FliN family flagellar motor switch protein n=1 Tax=Cellulomonas sp. ES6 TaxID=3039384 RepID=UPI0024B64D4E|nr:FliM/FliN family flagellar motor switch protein [Cellulomonas sp. ES6]WHP19017.1 FliM/FliN family flagellar motor switch protein [Cellulomonas sp. ES6]